MSNELVSQFGVFRAWIVSSRGDVAEIGSGSGVSAPCGTSLGWDAVSGGVIAISDGWLQIHWIPFSSQREHGLLSLQRKWLEAQDLQA
jgi:hypothetical protein